jgi:DNA-binding NarL/FixJ family response regulator
MRVLIADDHPLFRAALRIALAEAVPDADIIEAHVSAALAKPGVRNRTQASLVFRELKITQGDM